MILYFLETKEEKENEVNEISNFPETMPSWIFFYAKETKKSNQKLKNEKKCKVFKKNEYGHHFVSHCAHLGSLIPKVKQLLCTDAFILDMHYSQSTKWTMKKKKKRGIVWSKSRNEQFNWKQIERLI